jgi:hypothetical protein
MTRPATKTTTRFGLRSIAIGWSGPGSLIGFVAVGAVRSIASPHYLNIGFFGLPRRLPAVDKKHLAGGVGRLAGGEEHDRAGDLVRLCHALKRHAPDEPGFSFGIAGETVERPGLRRPRPSPLPRSLPEALDRLVASEKVGGWFGPTHLDAYLRFKRVEAEKMAELSPAELCARYAEVY